MGAGPTTNSPNSALNALMMHGIKREVQKAKEENALTQLELEKKTKEVDKHKQSLNKMKKSHDEMKKELHELKLQFDGNYAFNYKQDKRNALVKARSAKLQAKNTVKEKAKAAQDAKKKTAGQTRRSNSSTRKAGKGT